MRSPIPPTPASQATIGTHRSDRWADQVSTTVASSGPDGRDRLVALARALGRQAAARMWECGGERSTADKEEP